MVNCNSDLESGTGTIRELDDYLFPRPVANLASVELHLWSATFIASDLMTNVHASSPLHNRTVTVMKTYVHITLHKV